MKRFELILFKRFKIRNPGCANNRDFCIRRIEGFLLKIKYLLMSVIAYFYKLIRISLFIQILETITQELVENPEQWSLLLLLLPDQQKQWYNFPFHKPFYRFRQGVQLKNMIRLHQLVQNCILYQQK